MSSDRRPYLDWLNGQTSTMTDWVIRWGDINSHSYNAEGLNRMASVLKEALEPLGGSLEEHPLGSHHVISTTGEPEEFVLGTTLLLRKQRPVQLRVLLGIHMDTVYPASHSFNRVADDGNGHLYGPGVLDAKGGIAVMLKALEAFERSPFKDFLSWDLFLNPDEEIGSPGSGRLLKEMAPKYDLALLFEPALGDGNLVSERRGTGNFSILFHGQAAHAGREPRKGRSAINALAEFILRLNQLHNPDRGELINVGRVHGGTADNVVPDLAVAHFNVRTATTQAQNELLNKIDELVAQANRQEGIRAELHCAVLKPPKPLDAATESLLHSLAECGPDIGLDLNWHPSGGASDGNTLAGAGLPTLDSLGPRGGGIHSHQEFLVIDSLVERAKLVTSFLIRLAKNEINWNGRPRS